MVASIRRFTIHDLDAMPEDGNRYELLNGVITMAAAPTWKHQLVSRAIFRLIDRWVEEHSLGDTLFAPVDVVLDDENVLQPDIIFIDEAHLPSVRGGRVYGAPQLIVEVLSPTSRNRDSVEKPMHYALAGAAEYWLVDPQLETISVFTLIDSLYVERPRGEDALIHSAVLSGLVINPPDIFTAVDERMSRTTRTESDE